MMSPDICCLMCLVALDNKHSVELSNAVTRTTGGEGGIRMIKDILVQLTVDVKILGEQDGADLVMNDGEKLCLNCVRSLIEFDELRSKVNTMKSSLTPGARNFVRHVRKREWIDPNPTPKPGPEPSVAVKKCQICLKTFAKKSNLDSHLLTHTDVRKFKCQVCQKAFKREKSLKSHVASQHEDSRGQDPRICSFCGQSYLTMTGLKLHLSKHTGVDVPKPVVCSECNKSFRCRADLEIHSVVHSKAKPFSCDYCSKQFTQKASLKDHLNVHARTFVCEKCDVAFGRKRYLDQHCKGCNGSSRSTCG